MSDGRMSARLHAALLGMVVLATVLYPGDAFGQAAGLLGPSARVEAPAEGTTLFSPVADVTVSFRSDPPLGPADAVAAVADNLAVTRVELLIDGASSESWDPPPGTRAGTHTFVGVRLPSGGPVLLSARARAGSLARTWADSEPVTVVVHDPLVTMEQLRAESRVEPQVLLEDGLPTVASMDVPIPAGIGGDPVAGAIWFLDRYAGLYQLSDPDATLHLMRSEVEDGETSVHFGQHFDGIEVLGGAIAVHIADGAVIGTGGLWLPGVPRAASPTIPAVRARAAAVQNSGLASAEPTGEPELVWVDPRLVGRPDGETNLGWRVPVRGVRADGATTVLIRTIDAETGDELVTLETTATHGSAPTRPDEDFDIDTVKGSPRNPYCWWGHPSLEDWFDQEGIHCGPFACPSPSVDGWDAWRSIHRVYAYYYDSFGCKSWDCDEDEVEAVVHLGENQAYMFDECDLMAFGPGLVQVDTVAHEYTHGFIDSFADLVYENQPGALNESYSDIAAALIDGDWTLGEEEGGIIRDLSNPPARNQPDHMLRAVSGDGIGLRPRVRNPNRNNDWGGVHINSGIPNHAIYLLTVGGRHRTSGVTVAGIGRTKAARLVYRAMRKLSSNASFAAARSYTVGLARYYAERERYGFTMTDVCSVIDAYGAVGVGPQDTDCDGYDDDEDTDDDQDLVPDRQDNCRLVANPLQTDTDDDGFGNDCDEDDDNDGVRDTTDNCRTIWNPNQEDRDGDGIGEACDDNDGDRIWNADDNCRNVANRDQADLDRDGIGDVCDRDRDGDSVPEDGSFSGIAGDNPCPHGGGLHCDDNAPNHHNPGQQDIDGDLVGDAGDNCPRTPNRDQSDLDGDGLGDACDGDRDNDGVLDAQDNCPDARNPDQLDTDGDGTGLACDGQESERIRGGERYTGLIRIRDRLPIRIPLAPCIDKACPDRMPSDMRTWVEFQAHPSLLVRVVDNLGFQAGKVARQDGSNRVLKLTPSASFHYRSPFGGHLFQGEHYFLEMLPGPDLPLGAEIGFTMDSTPSRGSDVPPASDLASEAAFGPGASSLFTFDPQEGRTVNEEVDDQYAHRGVRFVNDHRATPRIIDTGIRGGASTRSAPHSLFNSADTLQPGSAGVPMTITFDGPVRMVGMYIGNGDGASSRATLTAYDGDGRVLHTVSRTGFGNAPLTFIGLDAGDWRVRSVRLDYGDTLRGEDIDNLMFR